MEQFDAVARIRELLSERGWTMYQFSKATGIPKSTLNRLICKTNSPTVRTVETICDGFGITLEQFFHKDSETYRLSEQQKRCLAAWDMLDPAEKEKALAYMDGLRAR